MLLSKFEIRNDEDGRHSLRLKVRSGGYVGFFMTYESWDSARKGIDSIKESAPFGCRFEVFQDDNGKHRFKMKAADGGIIQISEEYESRQDAERGKEAVKNHAPDAEGEGLLVRARRIAEGRASSGSSGQKDKYVELTVAQWKEVIARSKENAMSMFILRALASEQKITCGVIAAFNRKIVWNGADRARASNWAIAKISEHVKDVAGDRQACFYSWVKQEGAWVIGIFQWEALHRALKAHQDA